jgi:hypothetical protein
MRMRILTADWGWNIRWGGFNYDYEYVVALDAPVSMTSLQLV